jgi:phenylacetate-CoA ligase
VTVAPYGIVRLHDTALALRARREYAERERWPRERLDAWQRERVDELVRDAVMRSAFYRDRFEGLLGEGPVQLESLPELDKATMTEHFDDIVADPRLRQAELLPYVERAVRDELLHDRYRVMCTSGSSGRKGLFVWDREAWQALLAGFFRFNEMAGIRPKLPRLRLAALVGANPAHMTARISQTIAIGMHRLHPLPVTTPLPALVAGLNEFQPEVLHVFPSVGALLADEQIAGRLRIRPRVITTASEMRTPAMAERIRTAFGVSPTDLYGSTEGLWASECEHHAGMHVFEDLVVVENVDANGRPVPDGEVGARLLVTNLVNRTQPLIRFAIPDMAVLDSSPCACGRTLRRIVRVEGRADDTISLRGRDGDRVLVHPMQFAPVAHDAAVREFQVVQTGQRLRVRVVLRDGASPPEVAGRLERELSARLDALGAGPDSGIEVEPCDGIARTAAAGGGKLKLVVADPDA